MNSDKIAELLQSEHDERIAELLKQTAKIYWRELQTFFAAGQVIKVSAQLDLIQVAQSIAADDADEIRKLMSQQKVSMVDDQSARKWYENNEQVWAVVVSPWVLVQQNTS